MPTARLMMVQRPPCQCWRTCSGFIRSPVPTNTHAFVATALATVPGAAARAVDGSATWASGSAADGTAHTATAASPVPAVRPPSAACDAPWDARFRTASLPNTGHLPSHYTSGTDGGNGSHAQELATRVEPNRGLPVSRHPLGLGRLQLAIEPCANREPAISAEIDDQPVHPAVQTQRVTSHCTTGTCGWGGPTVHGGLTDQGLLRLTAGRLSVRLGRVDDNVGET